MADEVIIGKEIPKVSNVLKKKKRFGFMTCLLCAKKSFCVEC